MDGTIGCGLKAIVCPYCLIDAKIHQARLAKTSHSKLRRMSAVD